MKIGIIGTSWGRMHIGGFRGAGAEVFALCGSDPERTRRVAAEEGAPLWTIDPAELCRAVDLVVVASPDALHAEHVRVAIEHDRPVLCEKPLATSEADAAHMEAWARGRPCAVNFPYRTLPPFASLKAAVAGRRVRQVACTVLNAFASSASDASGDFGGVSHLIDAALWLARAQPAWVQAALVGRPVESAALHIGLSTGAIAIVTQLAGSEPGIRGAWSIAGDGWEARIEAGYVPARGGWWASAPVLAEGAALSRLGGAVEPTEGRREPWAEAHVETARHMLAAARGGDLGPLARFSDGLAVQRVLAGALRADSERARVDLG